MKGDKEHLNEVCDRLCRITKDIPSDMHEPDQQGLYARVVGTHLDNAFSNDIRADAIKDGYQEIVVILERDGKIETFNLADLIALARYAPTL